MMNTQQLNESRRINVLLVDDQRSFLRHLAGVVESLGDVEIHRATELEEARQVLEEVMIDIAFIDLQLSQDIRNRDGLTLIQEIRGRYQTIPVVLSARDELDEVREAMKLGAEDYVLKTEFEQRVPLIVKGLRRELEREQELMDLRARGSPSSPQGLVGTSVAMQNLQALVRRVATPDSPRPVPVLIQGSTGSGKELIARAIHNLGPHPGEPFFALNCGAIAETLVESQLFGHVKGAFTGADRDQEGYLSLVRRGTLFLDEVAELSLSLQVKLLRVLDDDTRAFRPVGASSRENHFRGRIVAASHVDLRKYIREGKFREDLYHRLNVLLIRVPPLAERREDIPALIQHFASRHHKPLHFTQQAIELLSRRPWPGNIRELRNAVERLAILAEGDSIDVENVERDLPLDAEAEPSGDLLERIARRILGLPLKDKIASITEALVREAMRQTGSNISEAAKRLGRHRKSVERLLKKLPPGDEPEE